MGLIFHQPKYLRRFLFLKDKQILLLSCFLFLMIR